MKRLKAQRTENSAESSRLKAESGIPQRVEIDELGTGWGTSINK